MPTRTTAAGSGATRAARGRRVGRLPAGLGHQLSDVLGVRPVGHEGEKALAQGRAFLDSQRAVVRSAELEAVTGLNRYEFARQFRTRYGTSPYRYSVLRRLDFARGRLLGGTSLAELALAAGFADQAHFTRMFRAAYGITPGRYARLHATAGGPRDRTT